MDKIIKGYPFWHDIINDNFTEIENNIDNINEITNQNTTQLSDMTNSLGQQVVNVLDLGIDNTGAVDNTALFNTIVSMGKYNRLFFPKGTYLGMIYVGSDKELIGVKPHYNATTGVLESGTILKTGVEGWGCKNVIIKNIGVDGASNGFRFTQGSSNIRVYDCITNVQQHGYLIEELGTTMSDIKVENCESYNGIHGFVSKAGITSFINCTAHYPTTNGFVMVSDNILGADKLSNCIDNNIINCYVDGNNITTNGLNCYARDYINISNSPVDHSNLHVENLRISKCGIGISLGESSLTTNVKSNQYIYNFTATSILLDYCVNHFISLSKVYRARINSGIMLNSLPTNQLANTTDIFFCSINNMIYYVVPDYIITNNNSLPVIHDLIGDTIRIRNTATTTITNFANSEIGKTITVVIEDSYTTISPSSYLLISSSLTGNGKRITMRLNKDYHWEEISRVS